MNLSPFLIPFFPFLSLPTSSSTPANALTSAVTSEASPSAQNNLAYEAITSNKVFIIGSCDIITASMTPLQADEDTSQLHHSTSRSLDHWMSKSFPNVFVKAQRSIIRGNQPNDGAVDGYITQPMTAKARIPNLPPVPLM